MTVRIGQAHNAKLVQLSDELGIARTTLAGDLLEAAITDAWKESGLTEPPLSKAASRTVDERSRTPPHNSPDSLVGASAASEWIFQANPKKYDIRTMLTRVDEHDRRVAWRTTRYRNEIRPGDRVYLWEAGPVSGVVAVGTVVTQPAIRTNDEWEMQFAYDQNSKSRTGAQKSTLTLSCQSGSLGANFRTTRFSRA
jgi:hypothetical protein